jgi:hypothetical protein
MSLTLRPHPGFTEAVIDDDCGLKRFYEVADLLSKGLSIRFLNKMDDFDSVIWEFTYKSYQLTLHYNIYTGISVFPRRCDASVKKENDAVLEVAHFLEAELMVHSAKKYLS